MLTTKTKVAGVEFNSYVLNASGPQDATLEELEIIGKSGSAGIMMKSCTIEPRQGNEEPRYFDFPQGYFQSMGLPNLGYKAYVEFAPKLKKFGKPILASVSGFSKSDYLTMVKAFQKSEADLIEVNLSCPNVEGKPIVGYDFEQAEDLLSKLSKLNKKPVGLKLPSYFDLSHIEQMAKLVLKHNIAFVTCINTITSLIIDPETESVVIRPRRGIGGVSGTFVKPFGLSNVKTFREFLGDKISIMGAGGISNGTDVFEYLLAGADAVQVATIFAKEGAGCFERINKEFEAVLEKKGYDSIESAKGKLKYI